MLSDLRFRLRAILRRDAMERELAAELDYHYDRLVTELVEAGVPREEARRRARLTMGAAGPLEEACRDARGVSALESLLRDVRYAVRQIRRSPGFTAAVVISLALGIGANTAVFTLIDAVLLRALPVAEPSQLQFVVPRQPDGSSRGFDHGEFRRLRAANPVFTDVMAYGATRLNVSIDGSLEPAAEGHLVSGSYFSVLGIEAAAGRTIGPEDDRHPGGHAVAVLGYGYWQRRFGLEPAVIGRTISLSGTPFTIIGVAPRGFFGLEVGRAAEIFVPVMMQPIVMPAAENWLVASVNRSFWLTVAGRLPQGRAPEQAATALAGLDLLDPLMAKPRLPGETPVRIPERLGLVPAATGASALRSEFSTPLVVLMGLVAVVLLIACTNVACLVLARSTARTPEFALRLALGAGGWRLTRLLLIETLVLAFLGGAGGLVLAGWATHLLVALMASGRTAVALDLQPDPRVLAFTAAVALCSGIFSGLAPALRARRVDVIGGLKPVRGAAGPSLRQGRTLVVVQMALCLVLLFGAGLFVRSLGYADAPDAGFDRTRVLTVRVEPPGSDQRGVEGASERLDRLYRDLIARVRSIPGVRSASMAHYAPTAAVGYSEPLLLPSGETRRVPRLMVYPGYFQTMGMALRAGRDFDARDLGDGADRVAVVNEAFVRQVLQGAFPVGLRLAEPAPGQVDAVGGFREIVGVVRDSAYAGFREPAPPVIYQPFLQTGTGRGQMILHVRTAGGAADVVARLREEVQRIDRAMPFFGIRTLADEVDARLARERLVAALSSVFGLLSLGLAAVGLYGLLAFSVARRTSELGVRLALGATRRAVLRHVLRDGLRLVLAGLAVGTPVALAVSHLAASRVSGLVFGLSAADPLTMAGAAALLIVVAAVAAYLPAARAARIDPAIALRGE